MTRRRWLPAATLLGLMAFGQGSFSAEPGTGQWLLESCRGDNGDPGRAFCMGYAMGLADLMLGQQRICMPEGVSSQQIRLVVQEYLEGHPDALNRHPVLLVIQALESNFACQ